MFKAARNADSLSPLECIRAAFEFAPFSSKILTAVGLSGCKLKLNFENLKINTTFCLFSYNDLQTKVDRFQPEII